MEVPEDKPQNDPSILSDNKSDEVKLPEEPKIEDKESDTSDETWETESEEEDESDDSHQTSGSSQKRSDKSDTREHRTTSDDEDSDEDSTDTYSERSSRFYKDKPSQEDIDDMIVEEAKSRYYKLLTRKDDKSIAIIHEDNGINDACLCFRVFYQNLKQSLKKVLTQIRDMEKFQIVLVKRTDFFLNEDHGYQTFACIDGDKHERFMKRSDPDDITIYSREEVEYEHLKQEKFPYREGYSRTFSIKSNDFHVLKEGSLIDLGICGGDEYFEESKTLFNNIGLHPNKTFGECLKDYYYIAELFLILMKDRETKTKSMILAEKLIDSIDNHYILFFSMK